MSKRHTLISSLALALALGSSGAVYAAGTDSSMTTGTTHGGTIGNTAGSTGADMGRDFASNDRDRSGGIDYNEWSSGFDGRTMYQGWDSDRDGALTEDEYNRGVYNQYDRDRDGILNDEEYGLFEDDAGEEGFWDM